MGLRLYRVRFLSIPRVIKVAIFAAFASTLWSCSYGVTVFAAPSISTISPSNGLSTGGDTITIIGSGFTTTGSSVYFDGIAGTITGATTTQLTVKAPAGVVGSAHVIVKDNVNAETMAAGGYIYTDASHTLNTWTGAASTDWGTAGNWSKSAVPSENDIVNISGAFTNHPTLSLAGPVRVYALAVGVSGTTTGRTLTISNGNSTNLLTTSDDIAVGKNGIITSASNTTTLNHGLYLNAEGGFGIGAGGSVHVNNKVAIAKSGSGASSATGNAAYGGVAPGSSVTYGNIREPTDFGSTGTSAGAGGVINIVAAGNSVINGSLTANGLHGTGGSVWVRTGGSLSGISTAMISANSTYTGTAHNSSGGRVALYANSFENYLGKKQAASTQAAQAGAGTVFTKAVSQAHGDLIISSIDVDNTSACTPETSVNAMYDTVTVTSGARYCIASGTAVATGTGIVGGTGSSAKLRGTLQVDGSMEVPSNSTVTNLYLYINNINGYSDKKPIIGAGGTVETKSADPWNLESLTVQDGGTLTSSAHTAAPLVNRLAVAVSGDLTVAAGGAIQANNKVLFQKSGPGSVVATGGATYGGVSKNSTYTYGSIREPVDFGSTAAQSTGNAGGAIRLSVGGSAIIDGSITADGANGTGGSIWISAAGTLSGASTGIISASSLYTGGDFGSSGGRVALYSDVMTYAGKKIAYGQNGVGAPGTVFTKTTNQSQGDLVVDGFGRDATALCTPEQSSVTYDSIRATGGGAYCVPASVSVGLANGLIGGTGVTPITRGVIWVNGTLTVPDHSLLTNLHMFLNNIQGYSDKNPIIGASATIETKSSDPWLLESLEVQNGGTLTSTAHTAAPLVNRLAVTVEGDLTVAAGGTINANNKVAYQKAGPGSVVASGGATYGGTSKNSTTIYGSVTEPNDFGSTAAYTSGNGGGVIRLDVTGDVVVDGSITADGSNGTGGSIWISTPAQLRGASTGIISASSLYSGGEYGSSGGRVALYASTLNNYAGKKMSYGQLNVGAPGTIFTKTTGQVNGGLIVDGNGRDAITLCTPGIVSPIVYDTIQVTGGGNYCIATSQEASITSGVVAGAGSTATTRGNITLEGKLRLPPNTTLSNIYVYHNGALETHGLTLASGATYEVQNTTPTNPWNIQGALTIGNGGVLTHKANTISEVSTLNVAADKITVASGGTINVDGKGYSPNNGPGKPSGTQSGGGYGGRGAPAATTGGQTYGSATEPTNIGSGGYTTGSFGGGAIKLTSASDVTNNGIISANGLGLTTGGSGGSIWVNAKNVNGTGSFQAKGGDATYGGGGGRIALSYNNNFALSPPLSSKLGSITGGDITTLHGTDISEDATITFGGNPADFVRNADGSITITTPPNSAPGPVDVVVTQNAFSGAITTVAGSVTAVSGTTMPDTIGAQTASIPHGYTYVAALMSLQSMSPTEGPMSGGATVEIEGANFLAPSTINHTWSDTLKTLPSTSAGSHAVVIGGKVYLIGGDGSAGIYSATTDDPTTWTNTGKTLPTSLARGQLAVIGDTIYIFGGDASGTIYSASTADPTTWTSTGATLPAAVTRSQLVIVGTTMYMLGGQVGGAATDAIMSAPLSSPTSWAMSVNKLPSATRGHQAVVVDDTIYIFGGSSTTRILSAPTNDPTNWTNTGKTLPTVVGNGHLFVLDKLYLLGSESGSPNAIFSAPLHDPTNWTNTGKTLPLWTNSGQLVTLGKTIYLFGGNGRNTIHSAPVTVTGAINGYNDPWMTDWQTSTPENSYTKITVGDTIVSRSNVEYVDSDTIRFISPPHDAGKVSVSLAQTDGQNQSLTNAYEYLHPPEILSISPNNGSPAGGDTVVIAGAFLRDKPTVAFGNQILASNAVQFDPVTQALQVVVPASAGLLPGVVDVTITNPDGLKVVLAQGYRYNEPPAIALLDKSGGKAEGGNSITITGTNFISWPGDKKPRVLFGDHELAPEHVIYQSSTQLTVTVPPGEPGEKTVRVVNPDNLSSNTLPYTYYAPASITSATPIDLVMAGGKEVTINGEHFDETTTLYVDSVEIPITTRTETSITFIAPQHSLGMASITLKSDWSGEVTRERILRYVPDQYVFVSQPLTLHATEGGLLTVEARDAVGNVLVLPDGYDLSLDLTVSTTTGAFSSDGLNWGVVKGTILAGSSRATFYFRDSQRGDTQVTVNGPANVSVTQTQSIASKYLLSVAGISDPIRAGVPSSVTVQAVDWLGNIVTDYIGEVRLQSSDRFAVLPEKFSISDGMDGRYTVTNGVTMASTGEQCVTAQDVNDDMVVGEQCAITVEEGYDGSATKLAVITEPRSVTTNNVSDVITVQLQNAQNEPVAAPADIPVYISSDATTLSYSPNGIDAWTRAASHTAIIKKGASSVNVFIKGEDPGVRTLAVRDQMAKDDVHFTDTSQMLTIHPYTATRLAVTSPAQQLTIQKPSEKMTVQYESEQGNPIPAPSDMTITIASDSSTGTLSLDGTTWQASPLTILMPKGASSASWYYKDTERGMKLLTITDQAELPDIGAVDTTHSVIVEAPEITVTSQLQTIDMRVASDPISVELRDTFGALVTPDHDITITAVSTSSTGRFSEDGLVWSDKPLANITLRAIDGKATVYYKDSEHGSPILTFADQADTENDVHYVDATHAMTIARPALSVATQVSSNSQHHDDIQNASTGTMSQTVYTNQSSQAIRVYAKSTLSGEYLDLDRDTEIHVSVDDLNARLSHDGTAWIRTMRERTRTNGTKWIERLPLTLTIRSDNDSEPDFVELFFRSDTPNTEKSYTLQVTDQTYLTDDATEEQTYEDSSGYSDAIDQYAIRVTQWPIDHYQITVPDPAYYKEWHTVTVALRDRCVNASSLCPTVSPPQGRPTTSSVNQTVYIRVDDEKVQLRNDKTSTIARSIAVTIPAGASNASFELRSDEILQTTVLASDAEEPDADEGVNDSSVPLSILARPTSHIDVTADPVARAGDIVSVRAVLKNAIGETVTANSPMVIELAANPDGEYSLSRSGWQKTTTVTIPSGQSSIDYYYRSLSVGTKTLNAELGSAKGSATLEISGSGIVGYGFAMSRQTIEIGRPSAITIEGRDIFGNIAVAENDLAGAVHTTSPTGKYSLTPNGPWSKAASFIIPSGASSTTVYYRDDELDQQATLTASDTNELDSPDSGLLNASLDVTVVGQTIHDISFASTAHTVEAGGLSEGIIIRAMRSDGQDAIVGADTTVAITSDSPGNDQFTSETTAGSPGITSVTIKKGESRATVYYRDTKAGTHTVRITSSVPAVEKQVAPLATVGDEQSITVTPAAPASLRFVSEGQSVEEGTPSDAVQMRLYDEFNNVATARNPITVQLESGCHDGEFSLSKAAWNPIRTLVVPNGASTATLYFKTSQASCAIHVSANGLSGDSQTIETYKGAARMRLMPQNVSPEYNEPVTMRVELLDDEGNIITLREARTIRLHSTLGAVPSTVTVPYGAGSVQFVYTAAKVGTPSTIKAYDEATPTLPDTAIVNDSVSITAVPGPPAQLALTPSSSNVKTNESKLLTLHLQNKYGADINASAAIVAQLRSNGAGIFTENAAIDSDPITSVVIQPGQSAVNTYYHQASLGTVNLTATADALKEASASLTITKGEIARYELVVPESASAGQTIDLQLLAYDVGGNRVSFPSGYTVYITAPSGVTIGGANYNPNTHALRNNSGGAAQSLTATFTSTRPGNLAVTAGDSYPVDAPDTEPTNATAVIPVQWGEVERIGVTGDIAPLYRGATSNELSIRAYNRYGVEVMVDKDMVVSLSTTSGSGVFAAEENGVNTTHQVVIKKDQSHARFTYRDPSRLGAFTITATTAALPPVTFDGTILITKPSYVRITSAPQTLIANHPSSPIILTAYDEYDVPTPFADDHTINLATTSDAGQYSQAMPDWGVYRFVWPHNETSAKMWYHDANVGTHTLTITTDGLVKPGTNQQELMAHDESQQVKITPQVLHHFLVTNISDPQSVNNATSVIVIAQDEQNYAISNYNGTVRFITSDPNGSVPAPYTFVPNIDKGRHTFVNSVVFRTAGEHVVRVVDDNGDIYGSQTAITVTDTTVVSPEPPLTDTPATPTPPATPNLIESGPAETPNTASSSARSDRLSTDDQPLTSTESATHEVPSVVSGVSGGAMSKTELLQLGHAIPWWIWWVIGSVYVLCIWDMSREMHHIAVYKKAWRRQSHANLPLSQRMPGTRSMNEVRKLYVHPLFWMPVLFAAIITFVVWMVTANALFPVFILVACIVGMVIYSVFRNRHLAHQNRRAELHQDVCSIM